MNRTKQQGAVLFIALIMLLVLTVLAVSSMRGVTLESKITGSRTHMERAQHLADAALREAEFRFSPAQELRSDMIESSDAHMVRNCIKDNTLNRYGNNRPCLLKPIEDDDELTELFATPLTYLKGSDYANNTGTKAQAASNSAVVAWMPYRGLDSQLAFVSEDGARAYWNMYRIDDPGANPEYGDEMRGRGTYYYLVNGQAEDEIAVQSIATMTFVN